MAIYQHPAAWLQEIKLLSPSGREWTAWQIVNDYSYKPEPRVTFGIGVGTGVGRNPRFSVGTGIVFNSPPPPEVFRGLVARFQVPDLEERPGWKLRATFVSPLGSFVTDFPIKPPAHATGPRRQELNRGSTTSLPVRTPNAFVDGSGTIRVAYDPAKDETIAVLENGTMRVASRYSGEAHDLTRTTRPITVRITGASINVE